jgi:hypothetical protein
MKDEAALFTAAIGSARLCLRCASIRSESLFSLRAPEVYASRTGGAAASKFMNACEPRPVTAPFSNRPSVRASLTYRPGLL